MSEVISFFNDNAGQWWEQMLRIFVACICGGLIGLERSKRQKEAGIRTHIILALGSALMIIVSQYGFLHTIAQNPELKISNDIGRVASNIVTGVSFLGAGVIFVRGGSIKGLTTAAGIWATSGIGMAIGTGMYLVGIFSTILLIFIQIILHRFLPASETMETNVLALTVDSADRLDTIRTFITEHKIIVNRLETSVHTDGSLSVSMEIRIAKNASLDCMLTMIKQTPGITAFSVQT